MGPVQGITLRRVGSPDVTAKAAVLIGSDNMVIGGEQQTTDRVMVTDRELNAAGWIEGPHHGDQIIYANGRVTSVQGRAAMYRMESDRVFIIHCLGG